MQLDKLTFLSMLSSEVGVSLHGPDNLGTLRGVLQRAFNISFLGAPSAMTIVDEASYLIDTVAGYSQCP